MLYSQRLMQWETLVTQNALLKFQIDFIHFQKKILNDARSSDLIHYSLFMIRSILTFCAGKERLTLQWVTENLLHVEVSYPSMRRDDREHHPRQKDKDLFIFVASIHSQLHGANQPIRIPIQYVITSSFKGFRFYSCCHYTIPIMKLFKILCASFFNVVFVARCWLLRCVKKILWLHYY